MLGAYQDAPGDPGQVIGLAGASADMGMTWGENLCHPMTTVMCNLQMINDNCQV